MALIDDLKIMLNLTGTDLDSTLALIIRNTEQSLRFKLGLKASDELPDELNYIPLEVCVRRFNRLKNEGMTSYSQEGESITFNNDDFSDFAGDIVEWRKSNQSAGLLKTIDPYRRRDNAVRY